MALQKKKVAGIIIFALILGISFSLPTLEDLFLEKRISKLVANEGYEYAYDLLLKKDWNMKSDEYFYLMLCNLELGNATDLGKAINELIKAGNRDVLQRLVDTLGVRLEENLAKIFYARVGITFDTEMRNYLSNYYFTIDRVDLAMALKENKEEIDLIYISYYLDRYEIEKLLSEHNLIPDNLKNQYYTLISNHLITYRLVDALRFNATYRSAKSQIIKDYVVYVDTLQVPKEMEAHIAQIITSDYFSNELTRLLYQEEIEMFYNSAFVANNADYKFQTLISDYLKGTDRQKALTELRELQGQEKYNHIVDLDEIIDILEKAKILHANNTISKAGILRTSVGLSRISALYDLKTGKELTDVKPEYVVWDGYSLGRSYFLRARYLEGGGKKETALFDSEYNELFYFGTDLISSSWLDDYRLAYRNSDGWFLFDAITGRVEDYIFNSIEPVKINAVENTLQVYAIGDTTYTAIEYEQQNKEAKIFYVIRNIEDNEIVFKHQLDCEFIGDDDSYIYGLKQYGNLLVLISIDKETLKTTKLPFVTHLYEPLG